MGAYTIDRIDRAANAMLQSRFDVIQFNLIRNEEIRTYV